MQKISTESQETEAQKVEKKEAQAEYGRNRYRNMIEDEKTD